MSSRSAAALLEEISKKYEPWILYKHTPKNILLILLSIACIPVSATITIVSLLITYFAGTYYEPHRPGPESKTILVTGVTMTKGLTIARMLALFHPHRIIAADTEPFPFISPGRYSRAITKFYRLKAPGVVGAERYIDALLEVIRKEKVDLWISCSSVDGAVEDGEVARRARGELGSTFEAVQFNSEVVEKLHEKDAFMEYIHSLGLPIPESHRCTSAKEVEDILCSSTNLNSNEKIEAGKRFILKPIGVDDKARSQMMTLLPLPEGREATLSYLSTLTISAENPYILQQYIKGSEYCTHSLVVHGEVKAFVACPSSDMLMQYEALPAGSALSMKMLDFTKRVADDGGSSFTGHLSFDFLISGGSDDAHLYPIECNPRAHTAVVLFAENPVMADTYVSIVDPDIEKKRPGIPPSVAIPHNYVQGYYWLGHDFVVRYLLPPMTLPSRPGHYSEVMKGPDAFWDHLWRWKDATWVIWDPVPFFVLYHVYWPMRFFGALLSGREWSRVNVSTGKMFGAK
jgi:catechol O-methyltransferase